MHALAPIDDGDGEVTLIDPRVGEAALSRSARRFELSALLRVLRRHGYAPEDIWFESARGAPASPGMIDSLRFEGSPRRAIVRLSVGLLGSDGPLPSYFRKFSEELADPRPYLAFVRFFDHVVAANLSYVAYPADGVALGSPLARAYQILGGARSPARVHALVRAIVPELALEVFPATLAQRESHPAARLGDARLDGTALVGWSRRTEIAGLVARLHAEIEHDDAGRPWSEVVRERCERVLAPLVRRGARTVEIRLRIGNYAGRAQLAHRAQLGVEPVTGGDAQTWEIAVLRIAARGPT
jgi:hypothetical protein